MIIPPTICASVMINKFFHIKKYPGKPRASKIAKIKKLKLGLAKIKQDPWPIVIQLNILTIHKINLTNYIQLVKFSSAYTFQADNPYLRKRPWPAP